MFGGPDRTPSFDLNRWQVRLRCPVRIVVDINININISFLLLTKDALHSHYITCYSEQLYARLKRNVFSPRRKAESLTHSLLRLTS